MFVGTGVSLINPTRDLLLRFRFKKCISNEATSFARIMRPQGVALPILGCAVWIKLNNDGSRFENARVCIAPVAPTPKRIGVVESALIGQLTTDETIEGAITAAQTSLRPRTSKYRATADYRHEMLAVLLRQTFSSAIERTQAQT
jgi:carbon-monoxide dehydrogenase medium subunit